MKKNIFYVQIGIVTIFYSSFLFAESTPNRIALHEEQRICGTTIITQHHDRILENTRRLHPDLPVSLQKTAEAQIDVGDTLSFYTINYKTYSYESIKAVCRYKSDLSYIFVGLQAFEENKVSQEDVDNFYHAFEVATPPSSIDPTKGIVQIMNQYIGQTPNTFGDSRVFILIYDIIDTYDPNAGSYQYIAGYFNQSDLSGGTYSNQKNLIHVDCNPLRPDREDAWATVAHEFQHLIHYGYDSDENTTGLWVNEGASEYSEVLCGFSLRNPAGYLLNPDRSLTVFDNFYKDLLDYKKVALWTYYLGEKFGPELIGEVVRNPANGVDGVRAALVKRGISLSFEDIFSNFVIANYADDATLDAEGYYHYSKMVLPTVPPATIHRFYPVSEQIKTVSPYAAFFVRFTAKDSTAVLRVSNQTTDVFRHRIWLKGSTSKLETISLDATQKGSYSLRAVGNGSDEAVMAGISLSTVSVCTYSVSSDFKDIAPPVILSGPTEFLPTGNSITIIWTTDEPSTSIVEYGTSPSYGKQVVDANYVTQHSVTLTGLMANTEYHYRVGSVDGAGNGPKYSANFTFTTTSLSPGTIATVQQAHSYGYLGRNMVHDSKGHLHLLHHEIVDNRRFIYHRKSNDNGASWSNPVAIDQTLFYGGMPSVAIDSLDRLHAAWHAQEFSESKYAIYYSRSDDGGASWSAPKQISKYGASDNQLYAAIAIDKNNHPHIVWNSALYQDENLGDVYHAHSFDGGITWSSEVMISQSATHRCFVPTIDFTSAGKAYVLWVDGVFEQQSRKVYGTTSSDYTTWQPPQALTSSGVLYDLFVSFVIDPYDRLHMVYSDNYTPGDIRIMYTYAEADVWSPPVPVARSQQGHVDSPNIASDDRGRLYLVYRDDMGTTALAKSGYLSRPWVQEETSPALRKDFAQRGEIFFSVFRDGVWSPASNISNDTEDNRYPELPRRVLSGEADVIWMRELSTAAYQMRHLHIQTGAAVYTAPLQITAVTPPHGATDVPYFKQAFSVQVDFNQRVAVDSLIPKYVVVAGAGQGVIKGHISYDTAFRRMIFVPNTALFPGDVVTVTLSGTITNESGIGLDGNGNGMAEGSPTDDYVWSFQLQAPDQVPPTFTIGVLQNPVLTRYMDIYIVPSEMLAVNPILTVAGQTIPTMLVPGEAILYKADYRLQQSGVLALHVDGIDLAGNSGSADRDFTAQFLTIAAGGEIHSADGVLSLQVPAGALPADGYLTIVKSPKPALGKTISLEQDYYQIGPASYRLQQPARIIFVGATETDRRYFIEQQQADGSWSEIASYQEDNYINAHITVLGNFRLSSAKPLIPESFALRQNYPNPFQLRTEKTTVAFDLPRRETVEIVVYNLLGERVRTLVQGSRQAGIYTVYWDGRDDAGRFVASGVYFYQLITAGRTFTRKMLVLY